MPFGPRTPPRGVRLSAEQTARQRWGMATPVLFLSADGTKLLVRPIGEAFDGDGLQQSPDLHF